MGDVVNLRTERKRASRRREADRAAENRLVHGLSKADRQRGAEQRSQDAKYLDQHRIDTGDDR